MLDDLLNKKLTLDKLGCEMSNSEKLDLYYRMAIVFTREIESQNRFIAEQKKREAEEKALYDRLKIKYG
jgi:hypothetical protein